MDHGSPPGSGPGIAFVSLTLAVLGYGALLTWLLLEGASVPSYVVVSVMAGVLAFMSVRRLGPAASPLLGRLHHNSTFSFTPADTAWILVFLGIGAALGILVTLGSVLDLLALVGAISFVPWSRSSLCRRHFLLACIAVWTGCALVVGLAHDTFPRLFLLIATWVFWSCSCAVMLRGIIEEWEAERNARKNPGAVPSVTRAMRR